MSKFSCSQIAAPGKPGAIWEATPDSNRNFRLIFLEALTLIRGIGNDVHRRMKALPKCGIAGQSLRMIHRHHE